MADGDTSSDRIEAALVNMQPLRDLAKNWDIDIASFLEDYLQDIVGHLDDDDDEAMHGESNGDGPPNFAQAALLLQNSSHIYSRKVEYLYSLVYAALDDLASSTTGVPAKHQRKTADASIDEFNAFDPDMQFLLLDDVLPTDQTEGGDKINLNDDDDDDDVDYNRTRFSSVTKTRLSLGGMSVTHLDRSTVAPNEARTLMTSLGDSGGGNLRLVNGNCHVGDHGMLIMPGTAVPGVSSNNNRSNDAAGLDNTDAAANDDDAPMMLDEDDDDDGGAGFQLADDPAQEDGFGGAVDPPVVQQQQQARLVLEKKKADPWALLDPHDVGTTKPKPLKIGVTYRLPEGLTEPPSMSVTGSHTRRRTLPTRKPVERTAAPVVSIATETFKATVANRRHQQHAAMTSLDNDSVDGNTMNDSSMFQTVVARPKVPLKGLAFGDEFAYIAKANVKRKAAERRERRKLLVQEPDQQQQAPDEADNLFGFDDYDDDDSVGGGNFDDGASNTGMAPLNDACGSPDAKDTSNLDAIEFEALCRAHIKAFAKGAEKYATETNLTKRVGDWQSRLAPILAEEEQRPEFNIHNYGDRVIEIMEEEIESKDSSDPKLANIVSFGEVTRDCQHYEVCRLFLASLNLTSAGNVAFTANSTMNSLEIKLLNTQVDRPMETYMAPSASVS